MTTTERTEYWQQQFKEYDEAGLSKAAFCRNRQLSEPSFYSWWRRLRGPRPGKRFVRARLKAESASSVTVIFSGIEIRLDRLPDPSWIKSQGGGDQ